MTRLSIVIPYLGNPKLFEETLVSVLENRPDGSEVLVVLGRHYDDPYDLGDEVRFLAMPEGSGLVECLNVGVGMSRAEIIHVLLCGTEVSEGWTDTALPHFDDPRVACVAPLIVSGRERSRVLAAGVDYHPGGRMVLLGEAATLSDLAAVEAAVLAPHGAAAFYRKSAVEQAGNFDVQAGDHWTVLDLALTLNHAGFRTIFDSRCRVFLVADAQAQVGTFCDALCAERFFWRWAPSGGWLRALALHAVTWAAEGWRRLPSPSIAAWTAGRLVGCCSIGNHRRLGVRVQRTGRRAVGNGSLCGPRSSVNGDGARHSPDAGAAGACR